MTGQTSESRCLDSCRHLVTALPFTSLHLSSARQQIETQISYNTRQCSQRALDCLQHVRCVYKTVCRVKAVGHPLWVSDSCDIDAVHAGPCCGPPLGVPSLQPSRSPARSSHARIQSGSCSRINLQASLPGSWSDNPFIKRDLIQSYSSSFAGERPVLKLQLEHIASLTGGMVDCSSVHPQAGLGELLAHFC